MIFFESNMNTRDSYVVANTYRYIEFNNINDLINNLYRSIEVISHNTLSSDPFCRLYHNELYFIANTPFDGGNGLISYLDNNSEIEKEVAIMDIGDVRIVCFSNLRFIGNKHYVLLYHKENCFETIKDVLTIFVDTDFNELDHETNNKELISLIGDCIDTILSHASNMEINYYANFPNVYADIDGTIETVYPHDLTLPIIVLRDLLNSYDIQFIIAYLTKFIDLTRRRFSFNKGDIKEYFTDKGFFVSRYKSILFEVIDMIYENLDTNNIDHAKMANELQYLSDDLFDEVDECSV